MTTTEHGLVWVVVLVVLLLALAGALRWDLLHLWWRDLLKAAPPVINNPPSPAKLPHAPAHLHTAETTRHAQHSKPAFHRSGRRG